MTSAWIIVPTYNEAENLAPLVERIEPAVAACDPPVDATVLVVDDARRTARARSPTRSPRTRPWLQVLHRDEQGRPRRRLRRGLPRARSRPEPTSSCRSTPTSRTTPPTSRA